MTTSNGKSVCPKHTTGGGPCYCEDLPIVDPTEEIAVHNPNIEYNTDGTEKHINLGGARYHVLWWDTQGAHCSEKNCEVNKRESLND